MPNHRNFPLTPQHPAKYQSPGLASEGCRRQDSPDSQFDFYPMSPDMLSTLSNNQLNELVHNHQKFIKTIQMLIQTSQKEINQNCVPYAIEILKIAQKILEYAAGCGKNIQKKIILNVLHDLACAYQKCWDLQQCCNYLQALIFNTTQKCGIDSNSPKISIQNSKLNQSKSDQSAPNTYQDSSIPIQQSNHNELLVKNLNVGQRTRNIKYNLQFAAINSQLKNHQRSCEYGDKAIGLIKQLFGTIDFYIGSRQRQRKRMKNKIRDPIFVNSEDIIKSIHINSHKINFKLYDQYIQIANFMFQNWSKSSQNHMCLFENNFEYKKQLKNFSIGYVMQMKNYEAEIKDTQLMQSKNVDYQFSTSCPDLSQLCEIDKVIRLVLLLSIAYFTKATELRLKSRQGFKSKKEQIQKNQQFIESQIYHLFSMIIYVTYIPVPLELISHISQSYERQYKNQKLQINRYFQNNANKSDQVLIDRLIMQKKMTKSIQLNLKGKTNKFSDMMISHQARQILQQIDPLGICSRYVNKDLEKQQIIQKTERNQNKGSELKRSIRHLKLQNWQKQKNLAKEQNRNNLKKLQSKCRGIINKQYNFQQEIFPKTPKNKSFSRSKYKNNKSHKSAVNINCQRSNTSRTLKDKSKCKNIKKKMNNYENFLEQALKQNEQQKKVQKKTPIKMMKKHKSSSFIEMRKADVAANMKIMKDQQFLKITKRKQNKSIQKKKMKTKSIPQSPSPRHLNMKSKGKLFIQKSTKKDKKTIQNCYQQYFS